jgi:hypothetical protein
MLNNPFDPQVEKERKKFASYLLIVINILGVILLLLLVNVIVSAILYLVIFHYEGVIINILISFVAFLLLGMIIFYLILVSIEFKVNVFSCFVSSLEFLLNYHYNLVMNHET